MERVRVYDVPTRAFHAIFAVLFVVSFAIGKVVDDESVLFSYHMISGLLMGGLLVFRLIWGFIGSENARFSGFALNPIQLKDYFINIASGERKKWVGHNPASSWAAMVMFACTLGLVLSGLMMTSDIFPATNFEFEDLHELFANAFVVVVLLHIAGLFLHSIRHQDAIALSMLDGKKFVPASDPTKVKPIGNHWVVGLLLIGIVILGGLKLYRSFDPNTRQLQVLGTILTLGETEGGEGQSGPAEQNEKESDDDGDEDK